MWSLAQLSQLHTSSSTQINVSRSFCCGTVSNLLFIEMSKYFYNLFVVKKVELRGKNHHRAHSVHKRVTKQKKVEKPSMCVLYVLSESVIIFVCLISDLGKK